MGFFDFLSQPTVYSTGGGAPVQQAPMWQDPSAWFAGLGSALGGYSTIDNMMNQRRYADEARRRAANFDATTQKYYADQAAWRNEYMNKAGGMMASAMEAMMAPLPGFSSTYAPMSDAAAKARRRGITAQAALRTGGNEGGYIDDQVGEGMAKDELARYEAATRLDALLQQGQMQAHNTRLGMWPALLSALMAGLGQGPVPPIRPMDVQMPNMPNIGSVGAFGEYLKYRKQQAALDSEREANRLWREKFNPQSPFSTGPSSLPRTSVYDTDYTTESW